MRRLTRRDLESHLFVVLTTAPATIQRGLASKDQQAREEARKQLVALLCDRIDGPGVCVVKADPVRVQSDNPGHHVRPGVFGADEDWPSEPFTSRSNLGAE